MTQAFVRISLLILFGVSLAGCSLPRGGPVENEILRAGNSETADLGVLAVTRSNVARVASWQRPAADKALGWPQAGRGGGVSGLIAAGDRLSLTIWENDDTALLTPLNQKSVQINDVVVSPEGTIFLPYLGEVQISNRTPDRARTDLQEKLDGVLSSPQVQLAVTAGRQNTVDLVGGVARAGSYPLPDRNFSVLSLISQGGGIPPGLRNPQLRLLRDGAIYGISVRRLTEDPRLDTLLRGGDKVIVEQDQRYFLSLGAAIQQNQIYFPQDTVSALDAVALIGGLAPARANPAAVLILRDYAASAVRYDGSGPDHDRMVFTLDLTNADGLFSARTFQIEPNDLVLVSESPINGLRTILGLLGQGLGLANATAAISTNN